MGNVEENKAISVVKKIFFLFAFLVFSYFILGQIFLSSEMQSVENSYQTFSEGWVWVKEDGTREKLEIPGKSDTERGELMVIENILPEDAEDNKFLFFRSSKQELKVYVDGELRKEYTTKNTRLFGKVSAVAWVPIELFKEDAGKIIRIEVKTDSSYSGVFHDIHYGKMWDIYRILFKDNGVELVTGLTMLLLGVVSIIISIVLKVTYKRTVEMEYLAWSVLITSLWILSNSVFRQAMFPSISVVSDMAFFMVMLIPIPVMLYMNTVQKGRYWKAYFLTIAACLMDAVVCTALHVFNIVDFSDTIKCMGVLAALSIGLVVFIIIKDIFNKKIQEYKLVALGIGAICVAGVVQLIIYFKWTNQFSGSVMAAGLVIVLIISFVNTINDVLSIEKEKQMAVYSNEAKGKFLANMSHEIRTPINSVLGMNTMILRECEDEDIREYANNIQNAGQTLLALINDILDFSKIESGKMEIVPVDYDFSSIVHDVVTMFMARAEEKGLKMNLSVNQNIPHRLFGDEVRIRQILTNLLSNAVKYTKEGSIGLTIEGEVMGEYINLHFEVTDTGIGIKPEDIKKLFVRFERIEEERNRNIEGTGLGMNITTQLLRLMDSELVVSSEYGVGSTFSFDLIQRVVSFEPVGDLAQNINKFESHKKYSGTYTAKGARILVVDDNMMNRKVFIGLMKSFGIKIDEAESGMECLEKIKDTHYDTIFLDHMMPQMDGIETLHHMKSDTTHACVDTPVIVLTANAILGAREMYLKEGFNDFLAKPVQPDKLEKMVEKWLPDELITYIGASSDTSEIKEVEGLPSIDGIVWSDALKKVPTVELLEETVNIFYLSLESGADDLEEAYNTLDEDEGALDRYRIRAHTMKSQAAIIGAIELSDRAKSLESAARDKDIEFIKNNTESFLTYWRGFKEKLSIMIASEEKEEIEDISSVLELLEKLKVAVDDMDVDTADDIIKALAKYKFAENDEKTMSKLSAAVVELDSDLVNEIVEELSMMLQK